MSLEVFREGLLELYQGEVVGEVALGVMLQQFTSPREQYALGTLLQLETETKARLRPAALELGIGLADDPVYRENGVAMGESVDGLTWTEAMTQLAEGVAGFVARYEEIAETAPPEYRDLADSMVVHERSILDWVWAELAGDAEHALDPVIAQLTWPLPKPQ